MHFHFQDKCDISAILKSFSNIPPFTYLPENVSCRREMNGVSKGVKLGSWPVTGLRLGGFTPSPFLTPPTSSRARYT